MPIYSDLKADSPQDLPVSESSTAKFFVCFIASIDPATGQPWCSDVRAALPVLEAVFREETQPELRYIYVGQKAEWKDLDNVYRKTWGLKGVPTLVQYQHVGGEVKETGRMTDPELFDGAKIRAFVGVAAASL